MILKKILILIILIFSQIAFSKNGMNVREFRLDDFDAINNICELYCNELGEVNDFCVEEFLNRIYSGALVVKVLEVTETKEVIGFCAYHFLNGITETKPKNKKAIKAELVFIAVAPEWQSHGGGKLLLEKLIEHAKQVNACHVEAYIKKDNKKGLDWFLKKGFYKV